MQTISMFVSKDEIVDAYGYIYCVTRLNYILCTFSQIFTPIYIAKKLTATFGETKKILRINAINVINEEMEHNVGFN